MATVLESLNRRSRRHQKKGKTLGPRMKWFRRIVGGQATADSLLWVVATVCAGILRYEFDAGLVDFGLFASVGAGVAVLSFASGKLTGLYRSWHKPATFDELFTLLFSVGILIVPVSLVIAFLGPGLGLPRSTLVIAAPLFLLMSGAIRTFRRIISRRRGGAERTKKALIYGAGTLGESLIGQLLSDPSAVATPVGLLDDDFAKANRRISGIRVLGGIGQLEAAARETGATILLVSIGGADSKTLQRVYELAAPLGLEIFVVPSVTEMLLSGSSTITFRQVGIEDLVGRSSVSLDSTGLSRLLEGQTILVTGAGGSIGTELCRQIMLFQPGRLVLVDHDETALQTVQLVIAGQGLLDSEDIVLADIRDAEVVRRTFDLVRPDVVFHAAALKHVSTLERYPQEAWKTNVMGSLNVLNSAYEFGVKVFVNISTDKAAEPTSVLGRSKLLAEQLTAWFSNLQSGNYLSVRFGNVLGSRGSLVPTVAFLLENNRPVTITDPRATRYFMSVSEACQLVLQAATQSESSSVFVLDMGEPVKIVDVVRRMLRMAGKPENIVYTGLRRGEKLHEVLRNGAEPSFATSHEKIERLQVKGLNPEMLGPKENDFQQPQ